MDVRSIACIGAGYVGGPTSAVIARQCPDIAVTVVDRDAKRIAAWRLGPLPVHEAGLDALVASVSAHTHNAGCKTTRNLFFSTDVDGAVASADIAMVAVNTPSRPDGALDTTCLEAAVMRIAKVRGRSAAMDLPRIIVLKSTAPVGTAARLEDMLAALPRPPAVVVNPEFLAEGTAVRDLEFPDRVVIGGRNADAVAAVASVYARWVPPGRILCMSPASAEVAKLAANAMLAQRLSAVHALGALCECTPGADVAAVVAAVGADTRVGPHFLRPSLGWGGSCFRKDVLALAHAAGTGGLPGCEAFWRAVVDANAWQTARTAAAIASEVHSAACNARPGVAVLGAAFKSGTGDCRDTAAAPLVRALVSSGLCVAVHDPLASASDFSSAIASCTTSCPWPVPKIKPRGPIAAQDDRAVASLAKPASHGQSPRDNGDEALSVDGESVLFTRSIARAAAGKSALVIVTEHAEYGRMDAQAVYAAMAKPAFVYDGRHVLDARVMGAVGFLVRSVGVSPV